MAIYYYVPRTTCLLHRQNSSLFLSLSRFDVCTPSANECGYFLWSTILVKSGQVSELFWTLLKLLAFTPQS